MRNQRSVFMIFIIFACIGALSGQVNKSEYLSVSGEDSLSLDKYINAVVQNHPVVKEAEEAMNAADIRIKLAQTAYFPNINANASYTRIGPVSQMTIPAIGEIQLYPENNYSTALNYQQNVYDFGRTSKDVEYQRENKNLASISLDEARQKLTLLAINNFYSLVYIQEALVIIKKQLNTLQEHLDFINKKKETGSSTKYEVLSTQVRISNVQSQMTDLESALNIQHSVMNSLLGLPEKTALAVRKEMNLKEVEVLPDSMVFHALKQRNEIRTAAEKVSLSELRYKIEQTKYYPVINVFASAGGKNGYFPDMNKLTANYAAGIGLNIPIFDGTRTKNNIVLAKSSILTNQLDLEIQRRNVTRDVIENENNLIATNKKIAQFELQLKQAEQAFSLAQTNYASGAITNLDLLDTSTMVSESRLMLLKAKIEGVMNNYKLKLALGDKLY